jgi:hypothetical protein
MWPAFPLAIAAESSAAPPARRPRLTLGLLMLVVLAVALPASIVGTIYRVSSVRPGALGLLAFWGLGILVLAVAIGAWWRHSPLQVFGQVILVTGLYVAILALADLAPDRPMPHAVVVLVLAVGVVLPLLLRRRALERVPPGLARERLLRVAAVGPAAALNLVGQLAYLVAAMALLR